jgi:dTDP-4-dehydrorhamnose reductase
LSKPDLKIVVVGRTGQVASDLQAVLASIGSVVCVGRPEFDLTDAACIRRTVRELRPDVLINAAAYTAVDQAESESDIAMKVNGEAPGMMAEEAKRLGALFITYSSDYVFDGANSTPYLESDEPNPLSVYGASKLAGDRAVEAVGGSYLIFRTSWVYSTTGKNFLKTIMKLAVEREELKIVDDQIGTPTWSRDIANATRQVIAVVFGETGNSDLAAKLGHRRGIYNLTSAGSVSWCGFARAIVNEMVGFGSLQDDLARIVAIPAIQYPLPARRPANSRLSNDKVKKEFGISLPLWRESLTCVMNQILEQQHYSASEMLRESKK